MMCTRSMLLLAALAYAAICGVVCLTLAAPASTVDQAPQAAQEGVDAFIVWAKSNARPIAASQPGPNTDDLLTLREVVGKARLVGVGESIHFSREFLGLRHRIVQFLVERMGFTAVALESGLPESKAVYDYVLGADARPGMWEQGFTSGMGRHRESRELVEWMRAYNRDPSHPRKLRFYGMDVAGYGSWAPKVRQVLDYLERVEPPYATSVRDKLLPLVERFARSGLSETQDAYSSLSATERQAIAAQVSEVADRFELRRMDYLSRSSLEEYDWAHRIAVNVRYACAIANDSRNWYPGWGRDPVMAQNVRWIRDREGPDGGVVVLAHNGHVQTIKVNAVSSNTIKDLVKMVPTGVFLDDMLGEDYRTIGFTFNRGVMGVELPPAEAGSLDGAMARVGLPIYLLDFGRVPNAGPVRRWLDQPIKQRVHTFYVEHNQWRSWDAVVFVETIGPATLAGR